ncbi:MAG: DUF2341 domain-containing protein [Chitinispirillaceae bacterium]|nr:DUF2341 domain-containing protein [Chitinispirillaceae bacterium]
MKRGILYNIYHGARWVVSGAVSVLLILNCSTTTSIDDGGGSRGGNPKIVGKILTPEGKKAEKTKVSLVPYNYNIHRDTTPIPTDTTDTSGCFEILVKQEGNYNIEAVDLKEGLRLLRFNINIEEKDSILSLSDDTLHKVGSIKIPISKEYDIVNGYVYIPGTTAKGKLSATQDTVIIDSLPEETILPSIYYEVKNSNERKSLRSNFSVKADSVIVLSRPEWKYYKKIILNTSATGANISSNLYNFPVLIRLNSTNFNFTQAKEKGEDILFTKNNDIELPYEIERWDITNKRADIWVKVDTLFGNNSLQTILMYWGNSNANARSDGRKVFDTTCGFMGVWHLSDGPDVFFDATLNRYDGRGYGSLQKVEGVIGMASKFGKDTGFIDIGNVCNPEKNSFTVSAWIKRDTTNRIFTIIAKSDGDTPHIGYGWNVTLGVKAQLHTFIATSGAKWGDQGAFDFYSRSDAPVSDTTSWHYVVAVINRNDSTKCRAYIDGVDMTGGFNGKLSTVGSLSNTLPLRIGAEADNGYPFIGIIDECRIFKGVQSEEWVRLSYINQGLSDKLVEFKEE